MSDERLKQSVRCVEISDDGEKEIPVKEKDGHRWVRVCTHSNKLKRVVRATNGFYDIELPLSEWEDDMCTSGCRWLDLNTVRLTGTGLSVK